MAAASRILVIGAKGQVAGALLEILAAAGTEVTNLARPDIDLARPGTIRSAIVDHRPTLVINLAAYTAVDRAEDEPGLAHTINAEAAGAVAAAAADIGAPAIHISTDYVFDGSKTAPYVEDDPTAPLGVYGATKLAGEVAVAAANARHVIVRTAWVCSPTGNNFVKTMLRLAAERPALRVVADQHGSPTFAVDLARAIATIAGRLHADDKSGPDHFGIFHATNDGLTSWHGFASAIVAGSVRRGARSVPVEAITTADFPTRARRPAYSKLSTAKLARVYGVQMPAWQDSLEHCLDRLIGPSRPADGGDGGEA